MKDHKKEGRDFWFAAVYLRLLSRTATATMTTMTTTAAMAMYTRESIPPLGFSAGEGETDCVGAAVVGVPPVGEGVTVGCPEACEVPTDSEVIAVEG